MDFFQVVIVQPIFNLLMAIYSLIPGGDFGIAVIIFTIIVRLALWPLVKKQLHQTKAMQKMQPELVKIKKQANGNKQLEGMMMMELYKKHDISPFRSIGILFIQIPIFIALYQVIQMFSMHRDKIDQYTYGFMKGIEPIQHLIKNPNDFNQKFLGFIDLTQQAIMYSPFRIDVFLLVLAIGAAVTQYIMAKQTMPKNVKSKKFRDIINQASQGKQADQSELNNMMMGSMTKFMPVMMFLIMISLPGAIALYYTMSNVIAVYQQHKLLGKDTEEMIQIADEQPKTVHKKSTAKARERVAEEANIIRIKAKDDGSPKKDNKKGSV